MTFVSSIVSANGRTYEELRLAVNRLCTANGQQYHAIQKGDAWLIGQGGVGSVDFDLLVTPDGNVTGFQPQAVCDSVYVLSFNWGNYLARHVDGDRVYIIVNFAGKLRKMLDGELTPLVH